MSFLHPLARAWRRVAGSAAPAALVWVALLALASNLGAQSSFQRTQQPNPPPYYAITSATLVTASGGTIENGTIVVENGVITALGRDVPVPDYVRRIDGGGLTVYPGLIDALTTLGHPDEDGAAREPVYADEDRDRPASTPWITFAEGLDPADQRLDAWRRAGFTTALSIPSEGFFPGQGTMVDLAGGAEEGGKDMVVKTPVALRVNFQGGPGHRGYPASLMGAISYVRQTFWDAGRYGTVQELYEERPGGLERPEFDPVLAPILEAVRSGRPVLFPASSAKELRRYRDLGRELELPTVLYGGQEAWAVADELGDVRAVLVDLDYPAPRRGGDPEDVPTLAELRRIERAPTAAVELARAGVPFAFYTGGDDTPGRALANARLSVRAGLSPDVALRALTLAPAELFGVADRVGSLEVGKIANLTVTEGGLFEDGSTVKMVFVDGRLFEVGNDERMATEDGNGEGSTAAGEGRGAAERDDPPTEWSGVTPMTEIGPYREADVWLVTGATIMTGTGQTIENGRILVRDGRIAAIGTDVEAPAGAEVIDATGKYVIPGIIDAHSHIAADAINEGSVNVSAMVGIRDVLDPDDPSIYRAAAGGVTTANVLHGSANPIGGKNAVIKMRWGADADGLLLDGAPPGIKFALGENVKRERNPARYPNSRMGVQDVIRQAFLDARAYMDEWERYDRARARGETVLPPRRDQKLEALAEVLRGERLVHAHSYRGDEILQLLRTAEEFGVRIATLQHVLEGYKVADEIAAHGAGASTFSDWWAYKVEAYDAIPYNAALMTERGVVVSINSDSGEEMRHLNQEAAKSMRWGGLDEHQALALVTINPARQLGIDDRVGSLEVGKDADLVIYNGHPLSVFSSVDETMIDGKIYFDREMDRERQSRLDAEKKTLLEKESAGRGRPITDEDRPEPLEIARQGGAR